MNPRRSSSPAAARARWSGPRRVGTARAVAWAATLLATLPAAAAAQTGSRPRGVLDLAVEVARRDHPAIDAAEVAASIDRIADLARARAGEGAEPAARIEALRAALFDDAKLEAVATLDSPENLHVDSVLRSRRGYCLSLSVVALAVAERLGMPLHGVAAPNHFFVRWDDGRVRRNLELTRRGAEVTDAEFRERIGEGLTEGSIYLRNLAPAELRGFLLHNRGFAALAQGRREDARADLEEAVRLLPALPEAHRNLGVLLGEEERWAEARDSFDRALRLLPSDADALVNRALCRWRLRAFAGAFADLDVALLVDPGRSRAEKLRTEWRHELMEHDWDAWQELVVAPLEKPPGSLAPGLSTTFFRGVDLREVAGRRVDREIDFDWRNAAPMRGVPADRFSARFEGWLKLPRDGVHTIFLVANDGARFEIDEKRVLDNWRDMGWDNWYGTTDLRLVAGWHRLRIEFFDASGGARLLLRLGVEGEEKPLRLADHLFHQAVR